MSAGRMQFLSPLNIRLLTSGRTELFADSSGAQLAGAGAPGLRSLTSLPLSPSSPGRAFSSLSATRRGLPQAKMSENGVVPRAKVLTIDTMNPTVKNVEYAVRGPIVARAVELERELSEVCSVSTITSYFPSYFSFQAHISCVSEMRFIFSFSSLYIKNNFAYHSLNDQELFYVESYDSQIGLKCTFH